MKKKKKKLKHRVLKPVIHDHLHRLLSPSVPRSQIQLDAWNVWYGTALDCVVIIRGFALRGVCVGAPHQGFRWHSGAYRARRNISFRMHHCGRLCFITLYSHKALNTRGVSHESNSTYFHNKLDLWSMQGVNGSPTVDTCGVAS